MVRAALILIFIGLAACHKAGPSGAFTQSRLPPGLETRFWAPEGWAWGLIQVKGRPAMRYGVAAPRGDSFADVIILPGHGETAEAWFETATTLIEADYTVWILEAAGQGGSERYNARRDLTDAPDFEADVQGLAAFSRAVVRPRRGAAVLASGTATVPALAAVERGYRPAVLILSNPEAPLPPANGEVWTRPGAADRVSPRRRAAQSWAVANPDLRLGGATRRWTKAHQALQADALSPSKLAVTGIPIVALTPRPFACQAAPRCTVTTLKAGELYPFAKDAEREPWLAAIKAALPH